MLAAAAGGSAVWWPFAILVICIVLIIVLITVVRLHAFVALILAAIVAGLLSPVGSLPGENPSSVVAMTEPGEPPIGAWRDDGGTLRVEAVGGEDLPLPAGSLTATNAVITVPGQKTSSHWVQAVELTTDGFGGTAGKVAVVIALASIISMCLMESGAADKVVRRFLAVFGEKRAGGVICFSGYLLSIPIFFDTFFMLLLPLGQALAIRTRQNYLLFVLAICTGASVTHSLIAPHPGPLAMAELLSVDLGLTIWVGTLVGLVPVACSWQVAKWLARRTEIPLRDSSISKVADLQAIIDKPESQLPGFVASIAPVIAPILLISLASTAAALDGFRAQNPGLYTLVEFAGNRNVALLIGTVLAVWVLLRQRGITFGRLGQMLGAPLETAGVIILITSAGGAFGLMLRNAGVGDAVKAAAEGRNINLILLAWLVAAVIRVAQGSATVSMMTAAAMVTPLLTPDLPYNPVYVFMAIGFGALTLSWMNDSGFWVVCKLSGFTEKETLKSWTVIATTSSVVGVLTCWALSKVIPGVSGG
jgi:GntP family gluconate:H+ symporter